MQVKAEVIRSPEITITRSALALTRILLALFLMILAGPRAHGQAAGPQAEQGFLLLDRANRLLEDGKPEDSAKAFQEVIVIAAKAQPRDRSLLLYGAYRGLCAVRLKQRDFGAAQAEVERARRLSSAEHIDTEEFALELLHAANVEAKRGEILAALTVMNLMRSVASQRMAAISEYEYRIERAQYHIYLSEFQQALEELELASQAARKIQGKDGALARAKVLALRGRIFDELGLEEASLSSYKDALVLAGLARIQGAASPDDLWFFLSTYTGAAGAQIRARHFAEAEHNLNQAMQLAEQLGDTGGAITVAKTRGDLEYERGNVPLALAEYSKSIDKGAEFTARVRQLAFGTPEENLAMLDMFGEGCLAGKPLFPGIDQAGRIQFHAALGAQLGTLTRYSQALCEMAQAAGEIEQLRTSVDEPRFRRSVFRSTADIYGDLVELLFESQRAFDLKIPAELARYGSSPQAIAFRFAEAAKARTFAERLGPALAASYKVKDQKLASLLDQERQTRASLKAVLDLEGLPASRPEVTSMEARAARMAGLRRQLEGEVQQIRAANPAVAALLYPDPIRMQEARELGGADALIEYMVTRHAVYCWVITRSGESEWFHFNFKREDLRSSVAKLREPMEQNDFQTFDSQLARRLYGILLAEPLRWIDAHFPPGTSAAEPRLVIVPDDSLYLLPFEILQADDGRFVADRYITSYAPSATALAQLKTVSHSARWRSELLLVGDSLSGAGPVRVPGIGEFKPDAANDPAESETLSRLFGTRKHCVDVVTGACADKKTLLARGLRDDLSGYRYVHFSVHAFAYTRFPEPSLILFPATGNLQDTLLSMSEIPALNLHAELVTLSACQSALGEERDPVPGEGIVGLTQAFFYAGAQSVVSSLWEAEKTTSLKLMTAFYGQLRGNAGNDRARALFLARKQLRQNGWAKNSPYLWGAFVLYGAQGRASQ